MWRTLPSCDQLGHRADGLLDRHVGVDAVLVVEVDVVGAEALQRALDRAAHVLGRAVERPDVGRSPGVVVVDATPNLVAITYSSRWPAIALPTSSSLVSGPYSSAVSRKLIPSSSARWIVAIDSASSVAP